MRSAQGIEVLELSAHTVFGPTTIYPTVIFDDHNLVLVDTGFPGVLAAIRQAFVQMDIPFERLTHIIMTHHDIDHIGSLAAILKEIPHKVEVLAHVDEKPYIGGDLPPLKAHSRPNPQMTEHLKLLPEEQRQAVLSVFQNFSAYTAPVDQPLTDSQELPCCGGITIIHTPGHTPGHICLYLRKSKTLIAGDALFIEGGQLVPAPPFVCHDCRQALQSLSRLTHLDIEQAVCYHGGVYTGDVAQRIGELLNNEQWDET